MREGDTVKQGQVIGRCGHSGHSSEPHLHFHLQDTPSLFSSMGLPIRFQGLQMIDNVEVGSEPEKAHAIKRGMRVIGD